VIGLLPLLGSFLVATAASMRDAAAAAIGY
jgi:hypothetical protein